MSNTSPPSRLRVLIIRHGETAENVARIIQGQLDTPLNAHGRAQAELTGTYLSTTHIDRIITSPLQRAADTARAILAHHPSVDLELDDRLKERAFGVLEGHVYTGGSTKSEETEGIERMEPFSERLAGFWNDLVTRTGKIEGERTETVVLVSHGAAISALMNQVLVPGRYVMLREGVVPARLWNCSVTELLVPVITTSTSSGEVAPGHLSRKKHWSIRPIHLGVQGCQFVLDHEMQKRRLAAAESNPDSIHPEALEELEARVSKTQREFERDPPGRKQLEEDTIKAPDGTTVSNDIGHGKTIGVVLRWSDVEHLKDLAAPSAGTNGAPANKVNVDELVK
ncbi:Histidine phosphatase superfamily, clade-1 [Kalmanozyma brasiliensis GHG001]|uniref:Phosphoglycerate mutase n=1 Tax=Kalmanozyma brasiliensis (strain GHG001) TaxID=1365824 RepID=V5EP93_KALBG|nr:Histidine phosphatase superfamily, clade-1 [Kalmanozyma brasiliensis GHG001]EST04753.1 Histidine phosphatase superfamily, clade-1 [Kalmanozyma brasiliensis GHG001]